MDNIVTAAFLNSHITKTCHLWKYDNGMILHVEGVELPEWVEIHFSNTGDGTTTLGLMHNGEVEIPNDYLETGRDINAYFYLHTGDSGYTAYQVIIPVKSRPRPNDGEPTVTQEEALDAAIDALNTSAQDAAESAESAEASAVRAEEAVASIDEEMIANAVEDYLEEHPVTVDETDPTVPSWAKQPNKPSYTASEVGAVPVEAGKGLSTNDFTNADKAKLDGIEAGADKTPDLSGFATKTELNGKVDKVSGKGLSTNDYTTAEKTKLAGIETGAQKNPNLSHYVTDSNYNPSSKTSDQTQAVGVDANGKLWTAPGSSITVDSTLSGSSTNPVQNKVVKAALDTIDGSFLKNSLAIVQAPPAVGSMLKVAESYFDQAYGSNTHLVYDSGHGLFAPSTTSSVEGEEGYPAIVCSQFAQALMKGIRYAQSRYVLANNHIAGWGWTTDGSGTYADFGTPVNDDASKDYMDARHQLKYALDHGWAYTISDVRKQIQPGDFIFYGLANVSTWNDVTHVALVLHVGLDDNYMITIESDDQTISGKRVGVVTKRFAIEKKGGHYLFGARFPIFSGEDASANYKKVLEDSSLSGTNSSYAIKEYSLSETQQPGFYSAVIDGNFDAARVEIGLHYTDADASTFDYSFGRVVKNAGRYAVTFYSPKAFDKVRLGATTNNAYTVNRWALFRGYFGQDWDLDPDVPTAAEVGAIPAPSSPSSGQYLAWNGSAWVAQSLPIYNGGVS